MMQIAKELVRNYIHTRLDKSDNVDISLDQIYVVWFSKTLQNWKCLISTTLPDGMYYEVTHNGDNNETYLDANHLIASGYDFPSCSIMKLTVVPPLPQPKQCQQFFSGLTTKEAVFSLWNGQQPLQLTPALRSVTNSDMTSTMSVCSNTLLIVSCLIIHSTLNKFLLN